MNEMKVWMTPEVEVQNFQANEYVSACYTSVGAGYKDFWDWISDVIGGIGDGYLGFPCYAYKDGNEYKPIVTPRDHISSESIDVNSEYNSGTLYGEVYKGVLGFDGVVNPDSVEKCDGVTLFKAANGGQVYAGKFTPVSEDQRCRVWS